MAVECRSRPSRRHPAVRAWSVPAPSHRRRASGSAIPSTSRQGQDREAGRRQTSTIAAALRACAPRPARAGRPSRPGPARPRGWRCRRRSGTPYPGRHASPGTTSRAHPRPDGPGCGREGSGDGLPSGGAEQGDGSPPDDRGERRVGGTEPRPEPVGGAVLDRARSRWSTLRPVAEGLPSSQGRRSRRFRSPRRPWPGPGSPRATGRSPPRRPGRRPVPPCIEGEGEAGLSRRAPSHERRAPVRRRVGKGPTDVPAAPDGCSLAGGRSSGPPSCGDVGELPADLDPVRLVRRRVGIEGRIPRPVPVGEALRAGAEAPGEGDEVSPRRTVRRRTSASEWASAVGRVGPPAAASSGGRGGGRRRGEFPAEAAPHAARTTATATAGRVAIRSRPGRRRCTPRC